MYGSHYMDEPEYTDKWSMDMQQRQEYYRQWTHGGLKPTSTNILRLISELEGSYQLLKYMAFDDDMNTIEQIKKRYYKLYFQTAKQEREQEKEKT